MYYPVFNIITHIYNDVYYPYQLIAQYTINAYKLYSPATVGFWAIFVTNVVPGEVKDQRVGMK